MSRRSFWAWGLEQDEPTEQQIREAAARLSQRYGVPVEPVTPPRAEDLRLRAPRISPPSSLAAICVTDDHDRAVHTYGRSFRDRIRAYNLQFPNPPDVVARPTTEDEVTAVLDWCSSNGYAAIPFGGGSSTVAGFEPPDGYDGIVTIDLAALDQVLEVDDVSRAARIQAGDIRARAGGAASAAWVHPTALSAELRVLVGGRLDRHTVGRALRHEPHAHRRLRGVGANGDADGGVGVAATAGQRGGPQPGPDGHWQRGNPGHHHRGVDADPGAAPVPGVGGGDVLGLHGRVGGRTSGGAGEAVARQLPAAGPGRGAERGGHGR